MMQWEMLRIPLCIALLAVLGAPSAYAQSRADALREKQVQLAGQLQHNAFGRPVVLASSDDGGTLRGDVHAILEYPFAQVNASLASPANWCDVLLLPFNVKGCEAQGDDVRLYIGRKSQSSLRDAVRVDFHFTRGEATAGLLEADLQAPAGPLGTHDYRIRFEAIPLDAKRTFVHLAYGYGYGALSRIAMQAYLSTAGAAKVGFSSGSDGALVGGMRGVLERNTMRYFLAIEATLAAAGTPAADRPRQRMETWFRESERYPRQLHEMDRDEYLAMKERELQPPSSRLAAR